MQVLAVLLSVVSLASAHFQLESPKPRNNGGMGKDAQTWPCAGPKLIPDTRVAFSSIVNSTLIISFYWDGDNEIFLGVGENPQVFPYKIGEFKAKSGKAYKVPLDFSKVPADVLALDQKLTIQAVCHQKGFDIYQCADFIYDIAPATTTTTTTIPAPTVIATASATSAAATYVAPVQTQLYSSANQFGMGLVSAVAAALFV
ncbi:UNVERIFIED_CONTAM: hypothetical protein HDU68_000152 [Siphonaria sp. JEL0065]|nr:hypothetical protein HDU68_000152 [Siphonaria sp. JEL0065]